MSSTTEHVVIQINQSQDEAQVEVEKKHDEEANYPQIEVAEEEYEEEEEEEYTLCSKCQMDPATMPNEFDDDCERICADCFWDLDADLKAKRRANPEWRYGRAFSAAKVLFNKTDEEAHAIAAASVASMVATN